MPCAIKQTRDREKIKRTYAKENEGISIESSHQEPQAGGMAPVYCSRRNRPFPAEPDLDRGNGQRGEADFTFEFYHRKIRLGESGEDRQMKPD